MVQAIYIPGTPAVTHVVIDKPAEPECFNLVLNKAEAEHVLLALRHARAHGQFHWIGAQYIGTAVTALEEAGVEPYMPMYD